MCISIEIFYNTNQKLNWPKTKLNEKIKVYIQYYLLFNRIILELFYKDKDGQYVLSNLFNLYVQ